MFERRLKIFLAFLVMLTSLLMVRAGQVQVVDHDDWKTKEAELQRRDTWTETIRGRILDATGKHELAVDVPCTDACVDYRAIPDKPDTKWVADLAVARVKNLYGVKTAYGLEYRVGSDLHKASRDEIDEMRRAEGEKILKQIDSMWSVLAERYQPTNEEEADAVLKDPRGVIEDIRHQIVQDVEMHRRLFWYRNFQKGLTKQEDEPRWERWMAGTDSDGPDLASSLPVAEETAPHVILRAVDQDTINLLGKNLERFPGLVLVASTHRTYPMKNVACHVIGRLSRVSADDVKYSKAANWDESRWYGPNDTVGREGVESLCEPLLRGSRGKIERRVGDGGIIEQTAFVPGEDVRLTIDADLQAQVQELLKHVREKNSKNEFVTPEPGMDMHGAAVVIDIKTAHVLALASNPDFNVNELESRYTALIQDQNNPLVDRATCDAFEPGSTVKPMVGLAGITEGVIQPLKGIECTGYLYLDFNGKLERQRNRRCWVASEFEKELAALPPPYGPLKPIHHVVPLPFPHRGHDGNADGFLTFSDALERSCNIFFEHTADWLGPAKLGEWYDRFGFGRMTGIGIAERRGLRPGQRPTGPSARIENCFAGIGQGQVWATPLQIANEAATIARGGIWMRPRLLDEQTQARLDAVQPRAENSPADVVDLHLDPEGLRQARIGMVEVVNNDAGTGSTVRRSDMLVAGKTGTATAARLWQILHDQNGKVIREPRPAANDLHPDTTTPWYRSSDDKGEQLDHAWFMGFAPAEKPEIAFCVLIEYGGHGGGGGVAGPVAANILDACVQHGYLHPHQPGSAVALAR